MQERTNRNSNLSRKSRSYHSLKASNEMTTLNYNNTEEGKSDLLENLYPANESPPVYNNARRKTTIFQKKEDWKDQPDRKMVSMYIDEALPDNSISTTKYTLLSFIPKNLMEQFSKLANVYFLLIGILQMIKSVSASDGKPVIYAPLTVVLVISALKDLVEDLKRRRDDRRENFGNTQKLTQSGFAPCKWMDLRVGDIVKIENNQYIPADVILLRTSEEDGSCFTETKNLDGETNLKPKFVDRALLNYFKDENDLFNKHVEVNYEKPNPYLYTFKGNAKLESKKEIPLTNNNFLLRACSLKSAYAIGMVAYSGHDTKIMLNSISARGKSSKLERMMNKQIFMVFIIQNVWCFLISIGATIWLSVKSQDNHLWYLDFQPEDPESHWAWYFFVKYGNWLVLFTNFVPISLLVTLEMVKFIQAIFITKDKRMMDDVNHTNAVVQTSRLMEELGQVNYIFSDKTGTLTCNIMEFKKVCVDGKSYGDDKNHQAWGSKPKVSNVDFSDGHFHRAMSSSDKKVHEILFLLSTCHTINIDEQGGKREYSASSPDELALVNFAKQCGYEYVGKDNNGEMIIRVNNAEQRHKILHVLEFDSDRKRMSIILRTQEGEYVLYCKGADSIIIDRMCPRSNSKINETKDHVEGYANQGLRTLLVAKKVIPESDYERWAEEYEHASSSIQNREENMAKLQEEIEKDLIVIGATAIEDKLQDKVGETIKALKDAGIQVWVLTGDKTETAINIGFSCKLLDNKQKICIIDAQTPEELVTRIQEVEDEVTKTLRRNSGSREFALVITGKSLIHAQNTTMGSNLSDRLYNVFSKASAVVACRVSPKQKRDIVELVKGKVPDAVTLGIGDGANDVNMITAAHVGVGIKGLEGYQAARASDFAIGEFKLLRRLLLFYGREAYRKNSVLVLYNFFKNQVLILPQFWFGFMNGMSGTTLYEPLIFQFYNICYAALPIVIYAVLDKEFSGSFLEKNPRYYKPGLKDSYFNQKLFWQWFAAGSLQAVFIALTSFGALSTTAVNTGGQTVGFFSAGMMAFSSLIICANLKIFIFSSRYNFLLVFVTIGSILFFVLNFSLFGIFHGANYYEFELIFGNCNFYIGTVAMVCVTTLMDFAFSRYKYALKTTEDAEILTEIRRHSSSHQHRKSRNQSVTFSLQSMPKQVEGMTFDEHL